MTVPLSQIPRVVQQDPVAFARCLWPDVKLYGKQREILHSVRDNFETVVVAGNMLGRSPPPGAGILGGGDLVRTSWPASAACGSSSPTTR